MFAYIAASPFVFIEQLGLSPRQFAIIFGCNAFALIGNSQLNRFRLRHSTPAQILGRQLYVTAGSAIVIAALAWIGTSSWLLLAAGLFVYVGTIGAVGPNTTAAALARYGEDAGSASALLGALQFGLAALAGVAVGTWHDGTRPAARHRRPRLRPGGVGLRHAGDVRARACPVPRAPDARCRLGRSRI